jgi:hypothetical protein
MTHSGVHGMALRDRSTVRKTMWHRLSACVLRTIERRLPSILSRRVRAVRHLQPLPVKDFPEVTFAKCPCCSPLPPSASAGG